MNTDFHYYATYCAAILAGYTHDESVAIAYSAELTDNCTRTFLAKIHAPLQAATSQLNLEMMDARNDMIGIWDITRIWASFHFLPRDLYAQKPHCSKIYLDKYRLICGPNGDLVKEVVDQAKGQSLQATGIAMHTLADTWAHMYYAGTPSLVINNANNSFVEVDETGKPIRPITFSHNPGKEDDVAHNVYRATMYMLSESSVMNLGHGRAGRVPDYSFMRYRYMPAWADYDVITKDNPSDFYHAFCQMLYALKVHRGEIASFEKNIYDFETAEPYRDRIMTILTERQSEDDACLDWKAFGEELSGCEIPDFSMETHQEEYRSADESRRNDTFLGKYILAALAQKSMVTNRIHKSGNRLAGRSIDYNEKGLKGLRDFWQLVTLYEEGGDRP